MKNSMYKNKNVKNKCSFLINILEKCPVKKKIFISSAFKSVCEDNIEILPKPSRFPIEKSQPTRHYTLINKSLQKLFLSYYFYSQFCNYSFIKNKKITVYLQKKVENVQDTKETNSSNFTNHLPLQLTFGFFMYNYTQKLYRYLLAK